MDDVVTGSFEVASAQQRHLMVIDAVRTACRGIDVSGASEEDRQLLQKVLEKGLAGPPEIEVACYRNGKQPSAVLVGVALYQCVERWTAGGKELLVDWTIQDIDGSDDERELVRAVHAVLKSTARFDDGGTSDEVCVTSLDLANVYESLGRADDSLAAALTATNFAQSPQLRLRAFDAAIHASASARNYEANSLAMAGRSDALSQSTAETDQLLAFDAVAAALRHLPKDESNRASALALIGHATHYSTRLAAWRPIVRVLSRPDTVLNPEMRSVWASLASWETAEWLSPRFHDLIVHLERARESLLPDRTDKAIVTSWTTGSFEHYAYRNAIPHSRSMLRERDLDQIVLLIGHELSHVMALRGQIGVALTALRAAAAELAARLWRYSPSQIPTSISLLTPPLETTELHALATAEQILAVARKRQILQATWSPWLEGIASFAELAVNPSANDFASDIGEVLLNCVDDAFQGEGADVTFDEWFRDRSSVSETMYVQAQSNDGPARLRGYIDTHRDKYLAGYLVVRSIVSLWRHRLGAHLNGADAYRLLLHRTCFGTRFAIPDLSLPVARFAEEAEDRMLQWVIDLASTHAEDIAAVLNNYGSGTWLNNRLVQNPATDEPPISDDEARQWLQDSVTAALQTNTRETDDNVERVADAGVATQRPIAAHQPNHRVADLAARLIISQRRVLVLGRVSCPFWLDSATGRLVCIIRATEHQQSDGRSSYDGMVTPVPESSLEELRSEMNRLRASRMTIHRVVDLVPNLFDEDRVFGRQALALTYGNWMFVQNRGIFTGLDSVAQSWIDDIRTRISPPEFLAAEYELAAFTSTARRVLEWSRSVSEWTVDGIALNRPTDRWVDHVGNLAAEVIDRADGDPTVERRVGRRLLEAAFGPGDLVEGLVEHGIRFLDDDDPTRRSLLVDAAFRSAFEPSVVEWLTAEAGSADRIFARIGDKWDITPFGRIEEF